MELVNKIPGCLFENANGVCSISIGRSLDAFTGLASNNIVLVLYSCGIKKRVTTNRVPQAIWKP
jgi:hypothetical protein